MSKPQFISYKLFIILGKIIGEILAYRVYFCINRLWVLIVQIIHILSFLNRSSPILRNCCTFRRNSIMFLFNMGIKGRIRKISSLASAHKISMIWIVPRSSFLFYFLILCIIAWTIIIFFILVLRIRIIWNPVLIS